MDPKTSPSTHTNPARRAFAWEGRMRRLTVSLAIVLSLVLVVPAAAGERSYSGHVLARDGGEVTFDVRFRNGKPKSVRDVAFTQLKTRCADDTKTFVSGAVAGSSDIDGNRRFEFQAGSDRFTGKLDAHGKAHGKIVVHHDNYIHGACVNAEHDWRAQRS